ncbi:hypothetical protein OAU03_00585 [Luminiphilus sp.]|nr:hypothetical protein [Luminiphilus sp.]
MKLTREMYLLLMCLNLIGMAIGSYGWYTGEISEAREGFFIFLLGALVFFWRARKRDSE